jgi:hypothetical protein
VLLILDRNLVKLNFLMLNAVLLFSTVAAAKFWGWSWQKRAGTVRSDANCGVYRAVPIFLADVARPKSSRPPAVRKPERVRNFRYRRRRGKSI